MLTCPPAYHSLQVVGSLLLTNPNVRLFASDVLAIGREVFSDTALALSEVARESSERVEPSQQEQDRVREATNDVQGEPSEGDLRGQVDTVTQVVVQGADKVAKSAGESVATRLQSDEKKALLDRLKHAVLSLRRREGYTDSVSTLSRLLQQYLSTYVHAAEDVAQAAQEDMDRNSETDDAVRSLYAFLRAFGDQQAWAQLEAALQKVVDKARNEPKVDELVTGIGHIIDHMFVDPAFFDDPKTRFEEVRARSHQLVSETSLRGEIDVLYDKAHSTLVSVWHDEQVARLAATATTLSKLVWPDKKPNADIARDLLHVFLPQLAKLIRYVPIPRLELSAPKIDLLLENLILEPGRTVNDSSFLPYKLRIESYNDLEVRKGRFRTASASRNIVRLKLQGISVRADEVGFWLRGRTGWLRLADEGIASFHLDERGIDVELEVEIGKDRMEQMVSLRAVRVHIHKLDWRIRTSRLSFFAWLLKPLLRPLIRRTLEGQLASAMAAGLHAANRELVFARERLRAARVSNPASIITFIKAVAARLVPPEDPDVHTRIGVTDRGHGVFEGVYTPGSIVRTWREEAVKAPQRIRERERDGWRNDIFDVHATLLA